MSTAPRILLIDEDALVRDTLAEMLRAAGRDVVVSDGSPPAPTADVVVAASPVEDCSLPWVALVKPVRVAPLLAAIDAALERRQGCDVTFAGWRLDAAGRILEHVDGRKVRLTDKETAILVLLAAADGPVERQDLLSKVWGYGKTVTTHTLETHVYRLRRKIETDSDTRAVLITEAGGYRLLR